MEDKRFNISLMNSDVYTLLYRLNTSNKEFLALAQGGQLLYPIQAKFSDKSTAIWSHASKLLLFYSSSE